MAGLCTAVVAVVALAEVGAGNLSLKALAVVLLTLGPATVAPFKVHLLALDRLSDGDRSHQSLLGQLLRLNHSALAESMWVAH